MQTATLIKPRLWDWFQMVVGTNSQKRNFISKSFRTPGRVLEIGCATGNVARAFLSADYTGIDIEEPSIQLASHKFRRIPNLRFIAGDLFEKPFEAGSFDYVVVSHTAHHLPDDYFGRLICHCHGLLRSTGKLVILDMIRPEAQAAWAKRSYFRLDRGEHFRNLREFERILKDSAAFSRIEAEVLETRKFGIRIIDQVLIEAYK
jgi:SAM-dependent methyltransferase